MSQFLILHGDRSHRGELSNRAEAVAPRVLGLEPVGRFDGEQFTVLVFPALTDGPSAPGALSLAGSGWACGAGVWLHRDHDRNAVLDGLATSRPGDRDTTPVDGLEGSFVIAYGDDESGDLTTYTDLVGTVHAYASEIGACFAISTSSLLLAAIHNHRWDMESVREFLATGTVFAQRTLFEGITKLSPCTRMTRDRGGRLRTERYWEFERSAYGFRTGSSTVPELAEALVDAGSLCLERLSRPVVDLTGGYDSRAVLAALLRQDRPIETVVNGHADHPDVTVANRIADRFGLRHRNRVPPEDLEDAWPELAEGSLALCDGEYDVFEYARVLLNHRRLAEDFGGSINGSGGEFCKGYWWELLLPYLGSRTRFDARRIASKRFILDDWADRVVADEFREPLVDRFAGVIDTAIAGLTGHRNTAKLDCVYLVLRMQRWQGRIASATNRIWPCVSPFMFRRPMEMAFGASIPARYGNRLSANLIEFLDPDLARMPLAQGYPAVSIRPSTIHRFGPLASEVGTKVLRKAGLGGRRAADGAPSPEALRWGRLLDRPEIRDLRDAFAMRSADLYVPGAPARAFEASRTGGGAEISRAGRILTLELLARRIHAANAGAEQRAGGG